MFTRLLTLLILILTVTFSSSAWAGETDLIVPDLHKVFFWGFDGHTLLLGGMFICFLGLLFGIVQFLEIKGLEVHKSMEEVSELIFETCKTYLYTQGKFLIVLELLVGGIMAIYFGWLRHFGAGKVLIILLCSVIGILGSYAVAWFGMRINTYANSRSAFVSLRGKAYPVCEIPMRSGMSIGMVLISLELLVMLSILLFVDGAYSGACFIGFAIGESLGASVLRIAGGIFTKIADIGSDLMKVVFKIKEDDARNPGVIADCVGDNAGDSVGPTADGFETYGVTGVAIISFILLAIHDVTIQSQLLVWLFVMRVIMIAASGISFGLNDIISRIRYGTAKDMNFEGPLSSLVIITSIVSVAFTYLVSYLLIPDMGDGTIWWKLASIITCGTIAGAVIPEMVKIFTSMESRFVQNIVNSSKRGGTSLNILAGLTSGNYSAYCMGMVIMGLMAIAYLISNHGLGELMMAPSIFALGLVAFGFLGMGPVTIAVDSYGPVVDNAQSIYELSLIEEIPNIREEIERDFEFVPNFDHAKHYLESNDSAGNTFKATSKPVLIGTAVVGATTMIFSNVVILTNGLQSNIDKLSILYPPFIFGFLAGGSVIYWFTGASIHAVSAGAYHAVEFIKTHIKLEGRSRATTEESKRVVEICTQFAQKGMTNLFLTIFFSTLAFACFNPFFFVGYLVSIAFFGLFQAIFMANAGGAWDNAKKYVEVVLKEKGTDLHAAMVVGDTIGDPFKDTSSVAMNPIIKFTTLFGLLAIELAIELDPKLNLILATVFFCISLVFVYRSFSSLTIPASE